MLELIIKRIEDKRQIALVEDGKLIEYYEEEKEDNKNEGNIYIGVVKDIIKGMQAAFVDIGIGKNSLIHVKDILEKKDEKNEKVEINQEINQLIKPNQKLLVQIKKDSNEKKGARISTHINLPGKYIVLMPNTDIITVSQKIENKEEQDRLIKLVRENISKGNGAVIRTSAEGKEKEIIEDIKLVESKWEKIVKDSQDEKQKAPRQLYKSENIVEKMLMDLTEKELTQVIVNDSLDYNEISKIKSENQEYKNLPILVKSEESIFNIYDLEQQIHKMNNRKIWLKCGGFITIDKTEALTAIDVNTGKYTGNKTMEDTVFKVNKEATVEIAKQLRLRDIGGIIIIDYIDMQEEEDKKTIENLLKEELKKDRSKTQIEGFTKLDLMEMTRKHICSHKST